LSRYLKLESKITEEPPATMTNVLLLDCRSVSVGSSARARVVLPSKPTTTHESSLFIAGLPPPVILQCPEWGNC
jgi:hypothetical protein